MDLCRVQECSATVPNMNGSLKTTVRMDVHDSEKAIAESSE